MAARELSRNHATRYAVFFIDSLSADGENLPTSKESGKADLVLSTPVAYGSIARAADGNQYILNGSDKWVVYNSSSGSGGGGSGGGGIDEKDIATDEEVDDMLNDVFA